MPIQLNLLVLMAVLHGIAWNRGILPASAGAQRLTVVVYLTLTLLWLGLVMNTFDCRSLEDRVMFDWIVAHREARGSPFLNQRSGLTMVIGGFPIQGIEGNGQGGFPSYLPLHQGLLVLFANFAILLPVSWGLSFLIQKRALPIAQHVLACLAMFTMVYGCVWIFEYTE